MGFGLGSNLPLYDIDGRISSNAFFIDNALITVLHKFGLIFSIPFIIFYLSRIYIMFIFYLKKDKNDIKRLMMVLLICTPMALLNGGYFTAQMIIDVSVSTYQFFLFSFVYALYHKQKIKKRGRGFLHIQ